MILEFKRQAIKTLVWTSIIAEITACQIVSRNNNKTPPEIAQDPAINLIEKVINKEFLPALTDSRRALMIFDTVNIEKNQRSGLSEYVFELEKSFLSTAQASTNKSKATENEDFTEVFVPFLVGKKERTLVGRLAKNREDKNGFNDSFGIAIQTPAKMSDTRTLISRTTEGPVGSNESYWFFDMPAFNSFLQDLRESTSDILDPYLSLQFTTFNKTLMVTVWSEKPKKGPFDINWTAFRGESDLTKDGRLSISLLTTCNGVDRFVEFELDTKNMPSSITEAVNKSILTKADPKCIKN